MGRGRWKDQVEEKRENMEKREKKNRRLHEAGGSDDDQDGGPVVMAPKPKRKGKSRTADKGDAHTQARREAKLAAAELVRNAIQKQQTFKDIPKFTLGIVEGKEKMQLAIEKWVREICGRFRSVQATHCGNVPVTPPQHSESDDESDDANMHRDEISYHILVYLSIHGNLEALVRETDNYVIATRPQPTDEEEKDGWSAFCDVDLPSQLFGVRNWKMVYRSAYKDQGSVEMGEGLLNKMVKVLLEINEANCKKTMPERGRMLDTLKVIGGEIPRLSAIFRFFLLNVDSNPCAALKGLSFWTTHWRKLGDAILHILLGLLAEQMKVSGSKREALLAEGDLRKAAAIRCLEGFEEEKIALRPEDLLRMASTAKAPGSSSSGGVREQNVSYDLILTYIMLIKCHNTLVPELIMRRGGNTTAFKVKMNDEEKKEEKKGKVGVTPDIQK